MSADSDLHELRAMSAELAAAAQSPWQPRCLAEAFAEPAPRFVLTMQAWINLDRARSPLLLGGLPKTLAELEAALDAFHYTGRSELTPAEMVQCARELQEAVEFAFSTVLPMEPPERGAAEDSSPGGFGAWVKILACLIVQVGLSRREAVEMPVAMVHPLIATMRHHQGWQVTGTPYAWRDLAEAPTHPEGTSDV